MKNSNEHLEKKRGIGTEREYLTAAIEMFEAWIDGEIVKAKTTYKNWQHDKGSLAFGYILGLSDCIHKLRDRLEIL